MPFFKYIFHNLFLIYIRISNGINLNNTHEIFSFERDNFNYVCLNNTIFDI
jgi:hypothetical protein